MTISTIVMASLLVDIKRIAILVVCMLSISTRGFTTVYTCNGSGNWTDVAWSPGMPPNPLPAGDAININNNIFLNTSVTINGSLNLSAGVTLEIIYQNTLNINNESFAHINGNIYIHAGGKLYNYIGATLYNYGNIYNSGHFYNYGSIYNFGYLSSSSEIYLASFGFLDNNGSIDNKANGILYNDGSLNIIGTLTNIGQFSNYGKLNLNSGGILNNNGILNNFESAFQNQFNIKQGGVLNNNSVLNNQGDLKGKGMLQQNGTFNNTHPGVISPGESPGLFTVNGPLDLGTGVYYCEINGSGQGTSYDLLAISGTATLSNAKLIVDWGGFTPSIGSTFTILTCGNRIGEFMMVQVYTIYGLSFNVSYNANSVSISVAAALPAELTNFSAKPQDQNILLEWQTGSEQNNAGFEIWRSGDSKTWSKLGFIQGQGNSTARHHYSFQDTEPLEGANYYRLRQLDHNGNEVYSDIISVQLKDKKEIKLFPNPAHNVLNLSSLSESRIYSIKTVSGQTKQIGMLSASGIIDIGNIEPGLYYLYYGDQVVEFVKL